MQPMNKTTEKKEVLSRLCLHNVVDSLESLDKPNGWDHRTKLPYNPATFVLLNVNKPAAFLEKVWPCLTIWQDSNGWI